MSEHQVKIAGKGPGHSIEVDGRDFAAVTTALSLKIDPSAGVRALTLTLLPGGLDIEMAAAVGVDGKTAEVLKALGWTPPETTP